VVAQLAHESQLRARPLASVELEGANLGEVSAQSERSRERNDSVSTRYNSPYSVSRVELERSHFGEVSAQSEWRGRRLT